MENQIDALVARCGSNARYLFARGYILSDAPVAAPGWWVEDTVLNFHVKYDPRLPMLRAAGHVSEVVCLGIIYDIRDPNADPHAFVLELAAALSESEEYFYELISHSGGRYVMVYGRDDQPAKLLTDAAGMRTALYYFRERKIVSSHARLLRLNAAHAHPRKCDAKYGFPGADTPFEGVRFLTPNLALDLGSFSTDRFWPRGKLSDIEIGEATELFLKFLKNSYAHLSRRYTTICSLTAGIDSRVTLSIAKRSGTYFTYFRGVDIRADAVDKSFAAKVTRDLGLDHRVVFLRDQPNRTHLVDIGRVLEVNTIYRHLGDAVMNFMDAFPEDSVHIRSNLSEIGTMFYRRRNVYPRSAGSLMRLWSDRPEMMSLDNMASFDEFAESSRFFDVPLERTSLFYWEHRMGTWHSQVALESDPAFESVSLYNSHAILALMLSISPEQQAAGELLRRAIAREWDVLTRYRVNGKKFF